MKKFSLVFLLALAAAACSRGEALEIPTGSEVTVQKRDGVTVSGKLLEVQPETVVLQSLDGAKTNVRRADIATIALTTQPSSTATATPAATPTPAEPGSASAPASGSAVPTTGSADADARTPREPAADRVQEYREVRLPAGTVLPAELTSTVASDTSNVEDAVRGKLRRAVLAEGVQALPAGTVLLGNVTAAVRSAKVKGRASIAFRFNQIDLPGDGGRMAISTATVSRVAPATKKKDATKIGVGAGAGAIIGGILGGGDGAAKGAAVGGAAGTGVVLSTRGDEVRLGPGTQVSVRLTAPLTVRVPVK